MKLTYRRKDYEVTLGTFVGYHIRNSWFARRRFLRAGKRWCARLVGWLPVLVVFAVLVVVVFSVLNFAGLMENAPIAPSVASVALGSVALLVIKDLFDAETERHRNLVAQFKYYTRLKSNLSGGLWHLFRCLGWPQFQQSAFDSPEQFRAFSESFSATPLTEVTCGKSTTEALRRLDTILDWCQAELTGKVFVDCDLDEIQFTTIGSAKRALDEIHTAAEAGDTTRAVGAMKSLLANCSRLIGEPRKPWRYRKDLARRQLIEQYLFTRAIQL